MELYHKNRFLNIVGNPSSFLLLKYTIKTKGNRSQEQIRKHYRKSFVSFVTQTHD